MIHTRRMDKESFDKAKIVLGNLCEKSGGKEKFSLWLKGRDFGGTNYSKIMEGLSVTINKYPDEVYGISISCDNGSYIEKVEDILRENKVNLSDLI